MQQNEEYLPLPTWLSWGLIGLLTALLVGWGLFIRFTVGNPPRYWNHGALPDTPASSVYATQEPLAGPSTVQQLPPLPQDTTKTAGGGTR